MNVFPVRVQGLSLSNKWVGIRNIYGYNYNINPIKFISFPYNIETNNLTTNSE